MLAIATLVATSPYTLTFGTEVLSEVPFAACLLGILLVLANAPDTHPGAIWSLSPCC